MPSLYSRSVVLQGYFLLLVLDSIMIAIYLCFKNSHLWSCKLEVLDFHSLNLVKSLSSQHLRTVHSLKCPPSFLMNRTTWLKILCPLDKADFTVIWITGLMWYLWIFNCLRIDTITCTWVMGFFFTSYRIFFLIFLIYRLIFIQYCSHKLCNILNDILAGIIFGLLVI